jgi:hypothetical protein
MYAIVILKEKYFNFTYASIRFDLHGQPTTYPIIICNEWKNGFEQAKQAGYTHVLFCNSGTVFKDINEFMKQIDNYPHQGLVGHIIDPLLEREFFSLHPQCFLLDMNKFSSECFEDGEFESYNIVRSDKNIHDDYTPLWIRAGDIKIKKHQNKFGQRLIATQLNNNSIVSNWHQKLRSNKIYLYTEKLYKEWTRLQQEYIDLAEQQLWITNNQKLSFKDTTHLISPASGLFWIMSAITKSINKITLVDISKTQIELAQELINKWNGVDYGTFVFNFIKSKKLTHLQFDKPLSSLEKIQVQKKEYFCKKVNNIFQQQLDDINLTAQDFQRAWSKIKSISIDIINGSIINQINDGSIKLDNNSNIWISNILDYKYTWLTSTTEEIDTFNSILKSSGAYVLK